ncbi:MAG: hypothetical protein KDK39_11195 [Leptospiraceae bacterium]|nr:hypothetical protein [Leptospiraceae bacterium]
MQQSFHHNSQDYLIHLEGDQGGLVVQACRQSRPIDSAAASDSENNPRLPIRLETIGAHTFSARRSNGEQVSGFWYQQDSRWWIQIQGVRYEFQHCAGRMPESEQQHGLYKSPMPGKILEIKIKAGDSVRKGETLLVLEAMKMENLIQASADGVVKEIFCQESSIVAADQVLLEVENN